LSRNGTWIPSNVILDSSVTNHAVANAIVSNCEDADVHVTDLRERESDAELLARTLPGTVQQVHGMSSLARQTLLLFGTKDVLQSMAVGRVPERRCFNFVKILPYSGVCRASCGYCWFKDPVLLPKVNVAFFEHLPGELQKLLDARGKPQVLTFTHYKTDCLAIDHLTGFVEKLCVFFESANGCYVQFLTKQADVWPILQCSPKRGTVVCFSLNAEAVSDILEPGTAPIASRLQSAQALSRNDVPVLVRVDPMLSFDGWQDAYRSLALTIADAVRPLQITLGTPRFQSASEMSRIAAAIETPESRSIMTSEIAKMGLNKPGVPRDGSDCEAGAYFRNMPMSYPFAVRVGLYKRFLDSWRALRTHVPVGLCEEPAAVWDACGLRWRGDRTRDCSCNFVPAAPAIGVEA